MVNDQLDVQIEAMLDELAAMSFDDFLDVDFRYWCAVGSKVPIFRSECRAFLEKYPSSPLGASGMQAFRRLRASQTIEMSDRTWRSLRASRSGNPGPSRQIANARGKNPDFVSPTGKLRSDDGWMYHATNAENAYWIAESGRLDTFKPWHGTEQDVWPDGSTEKRSYWSQSASGVWYFAPEDGLAVVLRTPRSKDFKRESTGDYYTTKKIPASKIEVLTEDGWIALAAIRNSNPGDIDACALGKWAWDRDPSVCGADPPSPSEAAKRLAKKRWTPRERWVAARLLRGE